MTHPPSETGPLDPIDDAANIPPVSRRLLSTGRLKAILTVFLVALVGGLSGVTFALVDRAQRQLSPSVLADIESKAKRHAEELARALAVGDEEVLRNAADVHATDAEVMTIVAVDPQGRVLLDVGRPPGVEPVELFAGPSGGIKERKGSLVSWSPSTEGADAGRVALAVSTQRLRTVPELRRTLLLVAGGGCLAALALGLLFVAVCIGPLVTFTESTMQRMRHLATTQEDRMRRRTVQLSEANGELTASMEKLRTTQAQLLKASRSAGMTDVATAVLHNIGNVLTSANVSSTLVADRVKASKVLGLAKATELLRGRAADLPAYLTSDERGKRLPEYVCLVADALLEERKQNLVELEQLTKSMNHIRVIISTQQTFAKASSGMVENVSLAELCDEAVALNAASYDRHSVDVAREYEPLPEVSVDRHKLFQILMNLLSNARHAVKDVPGRKVIRVSVHRSGDERIAIAINDNGVGISPETRSQLFQHGFTTKKDGHGFGLHSSALAASELGGSVFCHSDGDGQGATFTVEIPYRAAHLPAAAAG